MKKRKISKNREFFRIIVKYYFKEWRLSILMIPLSVITALLFIMIPLITQQINMDLTKTEETLPELTKGVFLTAYWGLTWPTLLLIALGCLILNTMTSFSINYIGYILAIRIEIDLRNKILEKLVRQDISYYSDKKIGEILTNVISDAKIVGDWAINIPLGVLISLLQITVSILMTFLLDWRIATAGLSIFVVILMAFALCYIFAVIKYEKIRKTLEKTNGDVIDRVVSIRLIKASGTEAYETENFKEKHVDYYNQSKPFAGWLSSLLTVVFAGDFLISFTSPIFAVIFYGSSSNPEPTLEFFKYTFAAYTLAQSLMIGPLFTLLNMSGGLVGAGIAASRISTTLEKDSILDPHYYDGIKVESLKQNIIFKDVEFRYPEKPKKVILPKFDFTFEYGKSYAFVGETGSGKSTIAKLLLRLYDPSDGKIIINNDNDLKDVNLQSYLKFIGYVEQEPQILFGDVFENIKYGSFEATDEEVIEAAKKAELDNLVNTWPDGYKTILGERGFMLSGGQKQRLVIARMFLKNPQLLILDEATSALDNIVEKEIQAKLNELMKNRTSVTIAHRLSTIKNVDEIIVLGANGKGIVQRGTFKELISTDGHFKNLYDAGLMGKEK
ncbi:ABC transporter ATP-binding protein [Spiroplasma diminutum]|uniref:ABC transporter ATP-binding protein/permease n=1 Tax=Spiroplasma diminutum CUAS-1 TaxID=1276221 RepID=S5M3B6_9MOLU|nr:ABC transporter ATP-binding protein [Spiroplasma diminutum]AGR42552.1 ABC transporter ATP-binding protein/permease [Spiroplasma diminutum CUAS-1]